MNLNSQRRLAAQVLGVGINRVWFDKFKLQEIKEAITKVDIKNLISKGLIKARLINGIKESFLIIPTAIPSRITL